MKHNTTIAIIAITLTIVACNNSSVENQKFYGPHPPKAESRATSNRVIEYNPAPGQFMNNQLVGFNGEKTTEAALSYANRTLHSSNISERGLISLGGFGGYVVVGFDHSIQAVGSASGYDFSITGNQFPGSSEPGIVWVMADVNGNKIPDDDQWYELMGAYYNNSIKDYQVTYRKATTPDGNITWSDNKGKSGTISRNPTHKQDYFPAWQSNEYTLSGTLLPDRSGTLENGRFTTGDYGWGYADNWSEKDIIDPKAKMKTFFSIADAVNGSGMPAELKYIDFIKVQTGVNVQGHSGVGELSTEMERFTDENLK